MNAEGLDGPEETGGTGGAGNGDHIGTGDTGDAEAPVGEAPRGHVPRQRERPADTGPPVSDAELVARVRSGDDSAYEELYRRHAASVRRYARGCCRDAHTAEDLAGEVFARTLQAIRNGSGPESAVRAYLLTAVRRVAATWGSTARREQLVEDFAVFAVSASDASPLTGTTDPGADIRAMHEADQSLAVQAFRTLPERWQAVLWHTAVEEESPSQVAPLLGLTANATAVLAHRAREGLRQAYLQAHVSATLTSEIGCGQYADRLGAHARGGLRLRANRELRRHLGECDKCSAAAADLADVNACLKGVLPVATVGWFAAAYVAKTAGAAAVGAGAATGGGGGAAGAGGLGLPAKTGIVTAVVAGAGLILATTLMSGGPHEANPVAKAPASPAPAPGRSGPTASPTPTATPAPARGISVQTGPIPASPVPTSSATPTPPPGSGPTPPPTSSPTPTPTPTPTATPTPRLRFYELNELPVELLGHGRSPAVEASLLEWYWPRHGLRTGGTTYANGVTVHGPSAITVDLNRSCVSFDAMAGLDRLSSGIGAVRFLVYGDHSLLYESGVVDARGGAVPVRADLAGHRTLRLVVRAEGGAIVNLADWADARISCH